MTDVITPRHLTEEMLRLCQIDGCDGEVVARGWCSKHYCRWKRYGDPLYLKRRRRKCIIEGCENWRRSRGYCARHYTSLRRYGDPLATSRPSYEVDSLPDGSALIPLHDAEGSVVAHTRVDAIDAEWLQQWRWSVNPGGYAYRVDGNRTVLLGRLLLGLLDAGRRYQCDHINRDRLDNRRSNLRVVRPIRNSENRGGIFA